MVAARLTRPSNQFSFILLAYDEQTINVSAREKAESVASIKCKLGVVPKGALTDVTQPPTLLV
jgi:hypothetical protein